MVRILSISHTIYTQHSHKHTVHFVSLYVYKISVCFKQQVSLNSVIVNSSLCNLPRKLLQFDVFILGCQWHLQMKFVSEESENSLFVVSSDVVGLFLPSCIESIVAIAAGWRDSK